MADSSKDHESSEVVVRLHELIGRMSKDDQEDLLVRLEKGLFKGKREHERKAFPNTVVYTTPSGTYTDFIKDISDEGVFIETGRAFSAGEEISMTFLLAEHKKRLKIQGEVVRIEAEGIGVKFKASQVQREVIRSFIDKV